MTKHTSRDLVWNQALQYAINDESFKLDEVAGDESVDVSKRTIRDTLNTLSDLGWLSKENPQAHKWHPGPLVVDEEISEELDDEASDLPDATPIDDFKRESQLSKGEVYVGPVDRHTGNAIISISSGHLNLGPIDESAVGERVKFRYDGSIWVECLDEEYIYDGYEPQDGRSRTRPRSKSRSKAIGSSSGASGDGTITDNDPDNKNKLLKGKK